MIFKKDELKIGSRNFNAKSPSLSKQVSEDNFKLTTHNSSVLLKSKARGSKTRQDQSKKHRSAAKEKAALDVMLYGAEQWNKTTFLHDFRPRDRLKEMNKDEFRAYKEVKR